MPASWAIAIACSTVFVEPPIAMSRAMAFSKAFRVRISDGRIFRRINSTIARPAASNSRR